MLNPIQVESVLESNEVDGQTKMPKSTRAPNAMQVGLRVLGEVKVDYNVDRLNVDTAGEKVGTNEVTRPTVAKFVENTISVGLLHLGVDVKATEAELGDFLGKQLDTIDAVAENDALIDFELGKKRVERSHLLALLNVSVKLSDTAKSQLVHEVDDVRVRQKLGFKSADGRWESSGKKANLPCGRAVANKRLEHNLKFGAEQLVSLIHHNDATL